MTSSMNTAVSDASTSIVTRAQKKVEFANAASTHGECELRALASPSVHESTETAKKNRAVHKWQPQSVQLFYEALKIVSVLVR